MPLGAFRADTLPPVAQGGADPAFAVAAGDVVGSMLAPSMVSR